MNLRRSATRHQDDVVRRTMRGASRRRASVRGGLALLGALAALGIVLVPSAIATGGGSVRKFDACLQVGASPACFYPDVASQLPAGASTAMQLTIKNEQVSSKKIGSANLTVPGLPVTGSVTSSKGTAILNGNVIQIRNLGLSQSASVTVGFTVTAPCSGGPFVWGVSAKETSDYSGSSTFTLYKQTGLTSSIAGTCKLDWVAAARRRSEGHEDHRRCLQSRRRRRHREGARRQQQPLNVSGVNVSLLPSGGNFSGKAATLTNGVAAFTDPRGLADRDRVHGRCVHVDSGLGLRQRRVERAVQHLARGVGVLGLELLGAGNNAG